MSHMWKYVTESFKSFVNRLSYHTLSASVYLHSSKWIRLVSLHAGWLSYSLFSALALKYIHSGNTSYPFPANRFLLNFTKIDTIMKTRVKQQDHLKDIRLSLINFCFPPFKLTWLSTLRRLDNRTNSCKIKVCILTDKWIKNEVYWTFKSNVWMISLNHVSRCDLGEHRANKVSAAALCGDGWPRIDKFMVCLVLYHTHCCLPHESLWPGHRKPIKAFMVTQGAW